MFNNIQVQRLTDSGAISKQFVVPFTFGPVDKTQFFRMERESEETYYLQLPRMSMTFDSLSYNSDRATSINDLRYLLQTSAVFDDVDAFIEQVQPTPYDFTFTLHILTEEMNDYLQIIEQILPFFNPSLYLRVKEFTFLNLERDLRVTVGAITNEFLIDQEESQKRYVNGTIQFTVDGILFRPLTDYSIIKQINTKYILNQYITTSAGGEYANTIVNAFETSGVYETSAYPSSDKYTISADIGFIDISTNEITSGGAFANVSAIE